MKFFIAIALLLLCGFNRAVYSDEPPKDAATPQKDVWFDVTHIDEEVLEQKKPMVLKSEIAAEIFQKKFPHLEDNWREKLEQPIEKTADARSFDDFSERLKQSMIKRDEQPFAAVQAFSKSELRIKILKNRGQYMWHHYYECLADFQVPRTQTLDEIFALKALELNYATKFKGIGSGDGTAAVIKALGKPDVSTNFQPLGMLRYSYFKEDVAIYFENFVVKKITYGLSEREMGKEQKLS